MRERQKKVVVNGHRARWPSSFVNAYEVAQSASLCVTAANENSSEGDLRFHSRKGASKHEERPSEADEIPMFVWKLILFPSAMSIAGLAHITPSSFSVR